MKVIVFGAGTAGRSYCTDECSKDTQIIAFADNSLHLDTKSVMGHPVISPNDINKYDYDKVVIAIDDSSKTGAERFNQMLKQLREYSIPNGKIFLSTFINYSESYKNRYKFLRDLSKIINEKGVGGSVAECGVMRGHFAAGLNKFFPDKKLFLFDTFKSFDERDMELEDKKGKEYEFNQAYKWHLDGNAEAVLLRCIYRKNVVLKVGYVPETLADIDDTFAFVNLDMDLYAPTLAALRFFLPRMEKGGVILVHDYYHSFFKGVKKAIDEIACEFAFSCMPIGDECSVAIIPLT